MKEYLPLFRSAHEGSMKEFTSVFHRELKHLLGNTKRFDDVDERDLDAIGREIADSGSISVMGQMANPISFIFR